MRSKLFVAFLSVAFIATSCGGKKSGGTDTPGTGEEIELRLNLTKGKKYDMKVNLTTNAEMNMMGQAVNTVSDMTMNMDYEVTDINPAGNYVVRSTYRSIKASGETMGMKYEYDSETDKATGMQAEQMSKNMKKMIGQYTEMEMDKMGKIIKTTNSFENGEGTKKKKGGLENMNYTIFPDKKIKVGDTWESTIEQDMEGMAIVVKSTYKLVAVKDGIAELSMDGTFNLKEGSTKGKVSGTQKGSGKIEIATGLSKEMIIDQDLDMELDDMGMKMPIKAKNKVTITIN